MNLVRWSIECEGGNGDIGSSFITDQGLDTASGSWCDVDEG